MNERPKTSIKVCQIIAAAIMIGVIIFAGITLVSHFNNPPQQPGGGNQDSTMLIVLGLFTVSDLMARFFVLKAFDRKMTDKIADREEQGLVPEDVLAGYQTRLIMSLALLEVVAFFALIVFMQDDRWEAFGLAMFLLLMMAANFPTENKFKNWVRKITGKSAYAGDE